MTNGNNVSLTAQWTRVAATKHWSTLETGFLLVASYWLITQRKLEVVKAIRIALLNKFMAKEMQEWCSYKLGIHKYLRIFVNEVLRTGDMVDKE